MSNSKVSQGKKPYESPSISRVSLQPEDAVLGFCKNPWHSGPVASNCKPVGVNCKNLGS